MADLSLLYIAGPPLVIALFLFVFTRSRIYRRICTVLILVVLSKAFIDLLVYFGYGIFGVWSGSAGGVDDGVLVAQFGLEVLHSGAFALEQLLLWGFVAFFAVIIGSIYLFITCLRKKGGSLSEKLGKVTFGQVNENPLTSKMDVNGLQSYLIIGLVTMPSMISIFIGMQLAGYKTFTVTVVYYVLLFYRFSLLAYTRIAKKVDLHFEKEDIGSKYQKRMLSWFTILNLVLSAVLLAYTLFVQQPSMDVIGIVTLNELQGLLVAILILPFVEGFAVLFFNRFWRFWARLGRRVRGINVKTASYSMVRGLLVGGACFVLFYAILSFATAATTYFSLGIDPPVFNTEVGSPAIYKFTDDVFRRIITPGYDVLLLPVLWSLVALFLFQFIKVLIGGSLTHRRDVAPEYSVIVSSITLVILVWLLMPATNFVLEQIPVGLVSDSGSATWTYWLLPHPLSSSVATLFYFVPAPGDILYVLFLDLPIWLFGSLLLTYFFIFRRPLIPQRKEVDVFVSSDFFKLFVSFCAVALASVATLAMINPVSPLGEFVNGLLTKLWFPNARDLWLFQTIGASWVFFHNVIRFLLTVFAPLILWVSVAGIWKWFQDKKVKGKFWYVLGLLLLGLEAVFFIDRFTYIAVIAIPLILAAFHRLFTRVIGGTSPKTMFRTTFLKISFYALILSEIYSTAIAIADRYMFAVPPATQSFAAGGNLGLLSFLLILIPHGLIEIPAIMLAGMIGLYIARKMIAKLDEDEKDLTKFMEEGKRLFLSGKIWYPVLFVTIFFAIAAIIEIYISWGPMYDLANMFGFA